MATRRAARKHALGACSACPQPAIPGQRLCQDCKTSKHTRYWQHVRAGRCVRCGSGQARPGRRTCFGCAIKISIHSQARYARECAAGICHTCHRRKRHQGRSDCLPCYLKAQRRLTP